MSAFGVYERKGSPFWWVWYGSGATRKLESSRKRRDDPLGWKQAFDYARLKGGSVVGRTSPDEARWDAWVDGWLSTLYPGKSNTFNVTMTQWRFVRGYLQSRDAVEPADVTYAMGQDYYAWRANNRRHPGRPKVQTARIEVRLLRRVLFEAVKRGFIAANPLADLKIPLAAHAEKPEITPDEEKEIRRVLLQREGHLPVQDRWMTLSFVFAIRQGWRLAETSFPLSRVQWDRGEVMIHSKGNKWRTVPLHPECRALLEQVRASGAKQSLTFPRNSPGAASTAWSLLLRGVDRDGIQGLFPHLCFHCCRVTCISRLGRAGVSESHVMRFVGHWSVTSHRTYARVVSADLQRCILPDAPSSVALPNPSPEIAASGVASP